MTSATPLPARHAAGDVDHVLTADVLSALMRSTWTWDDRALRRDLSQLLVDLDAAKLIADDLGAGDAIAKALYARARASAARFAGIVLGPKLIADTGNPLRESFLALASDPAQFGREEHAALSEVQINRDGYLTSRVDAVDYAPESTWPALAAATGAAGLATAMRAYGYRFGDSPFFASMAVAWQAVSGVTGCEVAASYASRLRDGELTATLAAAEQSGSWDPALVRTRAQPENGHWRLSGTKMYVPAADAADVVFVIARSVAGPSLFAVDTPSEGLTVTAHSVIDDTRPLFGITLSDTPATLVGTEGSGGRLVSQLMDRATTALAAEQVGLVEAAIGCVRTVSGADDQRVAEMVLDHAAAYSLWQRAIADQTPEAAAAAHIGCSAASVRAATTAAELRGSDTATTSLMRRALSGSLLFGGPALAHERLLDRLGI
jgi:alkylation response protein AidB-like acyl-CoA dehydrogenase